MGLFLKAKSVEADSAKNPITASAAAVGGTYQAKAAVWNTPRALTASATKMPLDRTTTQSASYRKWQADAWTGYERIGEIHYGLGLVANNVSKVRLFAAAVTDSNEVPTEIREAARKDKIASELAQQAAEAMNELTALDFPTLLRSFVINMSVPGECYLVYLPEEQPLGKNGKPAIDPLTGRQVEPVKHWTIRSTDEIQIKPGMVELVPVRGSTEVRRTLPDNTYIARIWKNSARYSGEPDSSMSAISDPIETLLILDRLVRSTTKTRLNAGMLFLPDDVTSANRTAPEEPVEEGQPTIDDDGGQLLEDLMESMVTPISDETSAASVVPMLVTGPRDSGEKIKHITFERRQSDEWLVGRAERALERVLQGLDIPKEIVTGLANVKYSNALVIDDNFYRANIEPLCMMLADALTACFLRPVLRGMKVPEEDLKRVVIWYDPSDIIIRPSASQDASDGYDKMLISGDAWRREHGFTDGDKPNEEELAFMLLAKMGSMPDEVTTALFNAILPGILGKEREAALAEQPVDFPQSAGKILQMGNRAGQVKEAVAGA